jgi:ribosomal protein S7
MSGKRKAYQIRYLVTENATRVDDPRKMADELGTQFTKTSDNTQYAQGFRRKKDQEEKTESSRLRKR